MPGIIQSRASCCGNHYFLLACLSRFIINDVVYIIMTQQQQQQHQHSNVFVDNENSIFKIISIKFTLATRLVVDFILFEIMLRFFCVPFELKIRPKQQLSTPRGKNSHIVRCILRKISISCYWNSKEDCQGMRIRCVSKNTSERVMMLEGERERAQCTFGKWMCAVHVDMIVCTRKY